MDKRYQVFISSTYLDLREERQAVSQALLRSDCFPAQMENWGAMDAEQMEAIKPIIDQSDYFLVISAGKYGSTHPETGLSYTEMEYDYAVETGKPIIRLLHRDPLNLLAGKQIETKAGLRKKLEVFRAKLGNQVVYATWENADQLEKETVFALVDIKKRKPSDGWVKASEQASSDSKIELANAKQAVAEIELQLSQTTGSEFDLYRVFEKLTDTVTVSHAMIHSTDVKWTDFIGPKQTLGVECTEASIARKISVFLLSPKTQVEIREAIGEALSREAWSKYKWLNNPTFRQRWAKKHSVSRILSILESEGVLDSDEGVSKIGFRTTTWRVSDVARRQVRGLSVGWRP